MAAFFQKICRVFRRLFAQQARPIMVYYKRNFQKKRCINVRISSSTFLDYRENLFLADQVYIGHFNFIEASHKIRIGEGVQITNYCTLTTHSSHKSIRLYGDSFSSAQKPIGYVTGEIVIGEYTFIGPYSVLMPHTALGKGCLVAAYSYLHGDYPDFAIIAGNPAKIVGDTREMDASILKQHPELLPLYEKWAKN